MKKVVAIIPIKLENERLPGKNLLLLGGKPLLRHILDTLNAVKEIDKIYVYCSNKLIQNYLPSNILFLERDAQLDLPTSNFTEIFHSFSQQIQADTYVYAHATAPFLTSETISECIHAVNHLSYDSAFTAIKIQDFLWQDGVSLNFDSTQVPRSQDLPIVYRETSGVYVFETRVFSKYKTRVGKTPYIKEVCYQEAIDINELNDFILAEKFMD